MTPRPCSGCGNSGHAVEVCQTKRVLEQDRELKALRAELNALAGQKAGDDAYVAALTERLEKAQAQLAVELEGARLRAETAESMNAELTAELAEAEADAGVFEAAVTHERANLAAANARIESMRQAIMHAQRCGYSSDLLDAALSTSHGSSPGAGERHHCPKCDWLTPLDAAVTGVKTMMSGSPTLAFTCPKCKTRIVAGAVDQVEGN